MLFVGIDAGKKHWVCVLNEKREEVVPKYCIQNTCEDFERLENLIDKNAKLCIEDTGSYSWPVYNYFKERGYDILMIKGLRAKRLREYLLDSIKTDLVDCHVLALSRALERDLPCTDVVSGGNQNELKPLVRLYCAHVKRRAQLRQRIYSLIQKQYPELVDEFYEPTCHAVLGTLRWTTREDWDDVKRAHKAIRKAGFQVDQADVERVLACLRHSVVSVQDAPSALLFLIDAYHHELRLLQGIEEELAFEVLQSPYAGLMCMPCIGLITTAVLIAEAGDVMRFPTAKKFVKYCGFRFSREQSGSMDIQRLKAVSTPVRWVLSSVAINVMRYDPALKEFSERLKKHGKKSLVVRFAVARKLLVRLYYEMKRLHNCDTQQVFKLLENKQLPASVRKALRRIKNHKGAERSFKHVAPGACTPSLSKACMVPVPPVLS